MLVILYHQSVFLVKSVPYMRICWCNISLLSLPVISPIGCKSELTLTSPPSAYSIACISVTFGVRYMLPNVLLSTILNES